MAPGPIELLVFRAEDRRFAVASADVREVLRAVWIESLPGAPPSVEGLIDYRGTPTPVYDVRARFGLPLRPVHPMDHLVVMDVGARPVALRVDRAEALVLVDEVAAVAAREAGEGLFGRTARVDGELLLVHDPERFLSESQRARLEAALVGEGAR